MADQEYHPPAKRRRSRSQTPPAPEQPPRKRRRLTSISTESTAKRRLTWKKAIVAAFRNRSSVELNDTFFNSVHLLYCSHRLKGCPHTEKHVKVSVLREMSKTDLFEIRAPETGPHQLAHLRRERPPLIPRTQRPTSSSVLPPHPRSLSWTDCVLQVLTESYPPNTPLELNIDFIRLIHTLHSTSTSTTTLNECTTGRCSHTFDSIKRSITSALTSKLSPSSSSVTSSTSTRVDIPLIHPDSSFSFSFRVRLVRLYSGWICWNWIKIRDNENENVPTMSWHDALVGVLVDYGCSGSGGELITINKKLVDMVSTVRFRGSSGGVGSSYQERESWIRRAIVMSSDIFEMVGLNAVRLRMIRRGRRRGRGRELRGEREWLEGMRRRGRPEKGSGPEPNRSGSGQSSDSSSFLPLRRRLRPRPPPPQPSTRRKLRPKPNPDDDYIPNQDQDQDPTSTTTSSLHPPPPSPTELSLLLSIVDHPKQNKGKKRKFRSRNSSLPAPLSVAGMCWSDFEIVCPKLPPPPPPPPPPPRPSLPPRVETMAPIPFEALRAPGLLGLGKGNGNEVREDEDGLLFDFSKW